MPLQALALKEEGRRQAAQQEAEGGQARCRAQRQQLMTAAAEGPTCQEEGHQGGVPARLRPSLPVGHVPLEEAAQQLEGARAMLAAQPCLEVGLPLFHMAGT